MSVQYLSDEKGHITAVQVPIAEWEQMKSRYPGIDKTDSGLQLWQMELIDKRLAAIAENPGLVLPIERLFEDLDNEE